MWISDVLDTTRQYVSYRRVFQGHTDVLAYRVVRDHPERCQGPVPLKLRAVPAPLLCRPGTMDPITLWDAFFNGYHLPGFALAQPSVIVDLGANVGYTAASFASRYREARVIAVEMDTANARLCEQNLTIFGNRCSVLNAAIWSSAGTVDYGGSGVHEYAIAAPSPNGKKAAAITIPGVLSRYGIQQVDYLKMDIEGAEAEVLAKADEWADRVRSMSIEVHPPATLQRCEQILTQLGFACSPHPKHPAAFLARTTRM